MDQKDKALKTALTAVGILAFLMVAYYWVSWRTRKTENDINFQEKGESTKEEKSEYAGIYSATEPFEGAGKRLAFISLNRKEDGSGYFGTAKLDPIGSETEGAAFLQCNDVTISEKEFFAKCSEASLGQISFSGEWTKAGGPPSASGTMLWSKDATEIANKKITLTRTGG